MKRTKMIAVFLAFAVVLCTLVFSAAAEEETCNISISVDGIGTVTLDETVCDDSVTVSFPVGALVEMTAEPDDENYEFLFWIRRVNDRICRVVSWDATYSFYAASYAQFEAVFGESESYLASLPTGPKHTVIYLSSGDNLLFQENVDVGNTSYYSRVPTTGMKLSGKTWNGWDKTADQVAATEGRVYVHPIYDIDAEFNVTSTIDGVTTTINPKPKYLSTVTLYAPATLNGENFSYWKAIAKDANSADEIASFYATYKFYVTGDVELEAVYGEAYPNGNPGASCRISGDFASKEEETLAVFAEHSVTENFTVLEHGMLLTKDVQIGNFEQAFRIGTSGVVKMTSNDTLLKGSYRINISNWKPTTENGVTVFPYVFARAYVIVKDRNGVSHTEYSQIYCVDYNGDTGSGGGTNVDDPFG